jgi:hypothetical protein
MSTGKPSRTATVTKHEAAQVERANAARRTPGDVRPRPMAAAQQPLADEPAVHATGARGHPS